MADPLRLSILPETLAVCRLPANSTLPDWAVKGAFSAVTRTSDELSIVCEAGFVPPGVQCEAPWRAFKVEGPLDFSLVGILAGLAGALAKQNISLFAISTFDTDYILVRARDFDAAQHTLQQEGYILD